MSSKYELFALLDEWGVIDTMRLDENSEDGLGFRLRVQKAAYLLHYLRVKPFDKLVFDRVEHGPYATELAKRYFNGKHLYFDADENTIATLKWFILHGSDWLRVAVSILSICEGDPRSGKENIYYLLSLSLPWVERNEFEKVYGALDAKGLIPHVLGGEP